MRTWKIGLTTVAFALGLGVAACEKSSTTEAAKDAGTGTGGTTASDAATGGGTTADATTGGGTTADATTGGGTTADATTGGGTTADATTGGGTTADATGGGATGTALSWEKDVKPIIQAKCAGCHTGGGKSGGQALDTYADFTAKAASCNDGGKLETVGAKVAKKVTATPPCGSPMPLGSGPLPAAEGKTIQDWVDGGLKP